MKLNKYLMILVILVCITLIGCGTVSATTEIVVDTSVISGITIDEQVTIPVIMYDAKNITSFEIIIPNNITGVSILVNQSRPMDDMSEGSSYTNRYFPNYNLEANSSLVYWHDVLDIGVSGEIITLFFIDVTVYNADISQIPLVISVNSLENYDETLNLEDEYPITQGSIQITQLPVVLTTINITFPNEGSMIEVGTSGVASMEGLDQYGERMPASVIWTSSNDTVLYITEDGRYTANCNGSVIISASSVDFPTISSQITVSVFEYPDESILPFITLQSGWNFISVPKILDESTNTVEKLFGDIDTDNRHILMYDARAKKWISLNKTDVIQPLNAYWIYTKHGAIVNFTYSNEVNEQLSKPLYTGWNAVGVAATADISAQSALACLNNTWKTLIPWNLSDGSYDSVIINGGFGAYSPERVMTLGIGYWLYVDSEGLLVNAKTPFAIDFVN